MSTTSESFSQSSRALSDHKRVTWVEPRDPFGQSTCDRWSNRKIAYELRTTNYELRTTNYELRTTNYELRTTNYELRTTNYELRTTNYELPISTSLQLPEREVVGCGLRLATCPNGLVRVLSVHWLGAPDAKQYVRRARQTESGSRVLFHVVASERVQGSEACSG